ncbi:MAG: DUF4384 domain-containing protein [Synergistaceae bacterium]|jgi:hypothetical protein|nr:DUF4384 domain-containing protein [Synergistaceae bacterium]
MKKISGFLWVFGFFMVGLFAMNSAAWADIKTSTTTATRDIVLVEDEETTEEKSEAEVKAAVLDIEEMHKNDFGLSFASDKENDVYNIGDAITMTFKSEEDAYLTILDFTSSGQMLVLFPNKWVADNRVKAGQEVKIPAAGQKFSMKAGGPVGIDVVKAIATNNDVPIVNPDNRSLVGPFAVLKDTKTATRDILLVAEEDETADGANESGPLKWSVASLAIATLDPSNAEQPSGIAAASNKDKAWTAKMWTNGSNFLTGEQVFVKFLSNKPAKLVSLVNEGNGNRDLLPEGREYGLQAGEILVLPGKDDKWKLVAAAKAEKDAVKAKLVAEDGTELELHLEVSVEE